MILRLNRLPRVRRSRYYYMLTFAGIVSEVAYCALDGRHWPGERRG